MSVDCNGDTRWGMALVALLLTMGCAETAASPEAARVSMTRAEAPLMLTARVPETDPATWSVDRQLDPEEMQGFDLSNADERQAFESYCRSWATDASHCSVDKMWFPVDHEMRGLSKAPATASVAYWVEMWPGGIRSWPESTPEAFPKMQVMVRARVEWSTAPDHYKSCEIHLHSRTGVLLSETLPQGGVQCAESIVCRGRFD